MKLTVPPSLLETSYSKTPELIRAVEHVKDWPRYHPTRLTKSADVVCIGISTGGPAALMKLLSNIEANFPLPIVIVQHIPFDFIEDFVRSLSNVAKLPVTLAKEGMRVERGEILIAPGNQHLTIVREGLFKVIRLLDTPAVSGHRPSVDIMFSSVAQAYHGRVLAVLMTGMGKDGARQMGELYNLGAITIAQDEKTSVVYGMPRAAIEAGYVHYVVSLDRMATTLTGLASKYCDRSKSSDLQKN